MSRGKWVPTYTRRGAPLGRRWKSAEEQRADTIATIVFVVLLLAGIAALIWKALP